MRRPAGGVTGRSVIGRMRSCGVRNRGSAVRRSASSRPRFLHFLLLVAFATLATCAAEVSFTILQTTDVHTFLEDSDRIESGGGWLRLATLVRRICRERGRKNVLLVDCGDTCQGTLTGVVSRGKVGVDVLRSMDYDVWTPGNHELDFGVLRLFELIQPVRDRVLCCNLELQVDAAKVRFAKWRMFEVGGARVAVIGATAQRLNDWLWGRLAAGYTVRPAAEVVGRLLPAVLSQKPDAVVLAIHQGWLPTDERRINEVAEIARRFPEIDLILGGHTHRLFPGRRIGDNVWYVQAGAHADTLAVVDVRVDAARHRVLNITSRLVTAGADVPWDPVALRAAAPHLKQAREFAARTVAVLPCSISGRGTPGETCETSELICRAVADATGADVVFHGKLSRADLPKRVTEQDLFNLIPYENTIGVACLTPAEIRDIIEEQWRWRGSSAYCGIWGLNVWIDAEGRVTALRTPQGTIPDEKRRLRVAFNSYTIAGAGRRFPVLRRLVRTPEADLTELPVNSRSIVRMYLQKKPFRFTMRRWVHRARPARK